MKTLLFFVISLTVVVALPPLAGSLEKELKVCGFPNKTDTKFHTYNCDETLQIQVHDAVVLNAKTQKEIYPVDFKVPLLIKLKSVNKGSPIKSNKVDVELASYSTSWRDAECKWNNIPTFGLLRNIDGCDYAKNCPLQTGNLDLLLPLDLSKYSRILKLLTGDKAYQLRILMKDGEDQKKKISCVVAQLKFDA